MKTRYYTITEALQAYKYKVGVKPNESFTHFWLRVCAHRKTHLPEFNAIK